MGAKNEGNGLASHLHNSVSHVDAAYCGRLSYCYQTSYIRGRIHVIFNELKMCTCPATNKVVDVVIEGDFVVVTAGIRALAILPNVPLQAMRESGNNEVYTLRT